MPVGIVPPLEPPVARPTRRAIELVGKPLPSVGDRAAVDVLVLGARLVLPGRPPMRVDLALNDERALRNGRARVREVGDLPDVLALDTANAPAVFAIRRGADSSRVLLRVFGGGGASR